MLTSKHSLDHYLLLPDLRRDDPGNLPNVFRYNLLRREGERKAILDEGDDSGVLSSATIVDEAVLLCGLTCDIDTLGGEVAS